MALKVSKSDSYSKDTALHEIMLLREVRDQYPNDPEQNRIIILLNDFEVKRPYGRHVCIVLELLGEDLNKLAHRSYRGIPINNVKWIIRQVLEGLDYLHSRCKHNH